MAFNIRRDAFFSNLVVGGNSVLKIPRYNSTAQAKPGQGNLIYDRSTDQLCYHTGSEWVCINPSGGSDIECIQELNTGHGVVIDKPLFLNRHGIAKIHLDDDVEVDGSMELDASYFVKVFESSGTVGPGGPVLTLTGSPTSLFQAPSASGYSNECLAGGWVMYVDVCITFCIMGDIILYLLKNGETEEMCAHISDESYVTTFTFHDIMVLSPGDTIGIGLEGDGELGSKGSFVTFNILGFDNAV